MNLKITIVGLVLSVSGYANAGLIANGGFDSNGLENWTTANSGLSIDNNIVFVLEDGPTGKYANSGHSHHSSERVIFQDFLVPIMDINSANFSFDFFSSNSEALDSSSYNNVVTPGNIFRIDIVNAVEDVFATASLFDLFVDLGGLSNFAAITYNDSSLTTFLNAHSGETLRLRIANDETTMPWDTGVDNISLDVRTSAIPEPSTLAIFALGMIGLASRRLKK
ncbi:MAG: PEP-CTERM sorting domain-containing protein [Colwellia sp.]|nr:PEP-CTERM sorting domain-containing protein [Colwellia sp.]